MVYAKRDAWLQEQESIKIANHIRQLRLLLEKATPEQTVKLQRQLKDAQAKLDASNKEAASRMGGKFAI